MARRTVLIVEDDLDGSEATQTLDFAFQGVEYQLDLSDSNVARFHAALEPYVSAARRVGGRKHSKGPSPRGSNGVDSAAVRVWAHANGIEISTRGRVSADIIDRYKSATA